MAGTGLGPGGLAEIFGGKTTTTPLYANLDTQKGLNEAAARQRAFGATTRPAAIADFARLLSESTPQAQKVSDESYKWFRDTISGAQSYNPFETSVRPAADYGFGKLSELMEYIPSLTRRANNQNAMNLGLAPGAKSSAVDRAQFSNYGAVSNQGLGSILQWVNQASQLDANERNNQYFRAVDALQGLRAEPDRLAYRALLPANVEAAGYATDTGNLAGLVDASARNIQGYESEDNWARRLGQAEAQEMANMQSMVGQVASIASSMYGGGGGGGGMYGGGGGGTGGMAQQSYPARANIQRNGGVPSFQGWDNVPGPSPARQYGAWDNG